MKNNISLNNQLLIKVPDIPKIILNQNEVFGGVKSNNKNNTVFRLKQANSMDWPASYILEKGEPGFELDTGKLKIGDGYTIWSELDYVKGKVILNQDDILEYDENTLLIKGQKEAEIGQIPSKAEDGAITWITPPSTAEIDALTGRIAMLENEIITNIASEQDIGLVKGSNNINKISVNQDGTMSINTIGVEKIKNNGYTLILNGGQAQ